VSDGCIDDPVRSPGRLAELELGMETHEVRGDGLNCLRARPPGMLDGIRIGAAATDVLRLRVAQQPRKELAV
jgi:hypothetical protein